MTTENSLSSFLRNSVTACSSSAAMIPSSTYTIKYIDFSSFKNKHGSQLDCFKPLHSAKLLKRSFQHLGACFKPYILFSNLHTCPVPSLNPSG
ncbi:unnamed protein product [Larinioides sclopetarius]|uniref:Uncharacterized protein n=1 Tax=Larinioides sclopetarius TaxID=280406 RepID=A0AAV2B845_9ARAC